MSGLPARAPERHEGAPACPVHPYGYHLKPRVNEAGSTRVFRDASVLGVPRRCALLEEELMESERELDLLDELWVRERAANGRPATVIGAAAGAAVAVTVALSDASTGAAVATGIVAAGGVLAIARAEAVAVATRLRRIRDWHRRVGVPR
ncbi:hypothetical protein [Demequina mangrovi]|uniref:Uncharacterized protein n=1 Tax=Demequina mangrovi TaxID=1043493 RepID=A0A1H6U9U3_9MICO|nr:hypothetical protein [Demequina mangrovi]SEI89148.1 hypothetical protein SAMN05421637_0323 [Demequina mangrovi]